MTTQSIDTESAAYKAMKRHYRLADDIEAGTFAMRDRSNEWLPQFEGEDDKEYAWRLGNAYLKNLLGRAADLMIGHIFREGIDKTDLTLSEEVANDFDRLGNSIDAYAAKVARYLATHGVAHTYTDFPKVNGPRSLADEQRGKIRPYAILINPADLFFALPVPKNGVDEPADIRWKAKTTEADGLGDAEVIDIRRIYVATGELAAIKVGAEMMPTPAGAVVYEVWRSSAETDYIRIAAGILESMDYIPLRTAYANYQGFMRSIPTLEAVAAKNLEHWQASSDHNSIVQMSRFPMFYATGLQSDEVEKINILGPRVKLSSTNENARFGYAEVTGEAVNVSFKDLERITREADERSVEALYKAGSDTATGRRIDLLESLSPAQRIARETERHVNQVLEDFGKWLNKDVGQIRIDLNFGYSENEQMIIEALHRARALGDVSREYYLQRLQELGVIGDDVTVEQLVDQANQERDEMASLLRDAPSPQLPPPDADDQQAA